MQSLKDKATSVVTGDAYDKPAKTEDGAMTTQDSSDAHTLKGTSADPNPPPREPDAAEKLVNKTSSKVDELSNKAGDMADKAKNTEGGQKAMDQASKTETGQKALNVADEKTN